MFACLPAVAVRHSRFLPQNGRSGMEFHPAFERKLKTFVDFALLYALQGFVISLIAEEDRHEPRDHLIS